jgi:hypothetical protein
MLDETGASYARRDGCIICWTTARRQSSRDSRTHAKRTHTLTHSYRALRTRARTQSCGPSRILHRSCQQSAGVITSKVCACAPIMCWLPGDLIGGADALSARARALSFSLSPPPPRSFLSVQYVSAKQDPAFLRQAREVLLFSMMSEKASK